jgi:hypothetical protein
MEKWNLDRIVDLQHATVGQPEQSSAFRKHDAAAFRRKVVAGQVPSSRWERDSAEATTLQIRNFLSIESVAIHGEMIDCQNSGRAVNVHCCINCFALLRTKILWMTFCWSPAWCQCLRLTLHDRTCKCLFLLGGAMHKIEF